MPDVRESDGLSGGRTGRDGDQAEILALVAPLRRFVLSRVRDRHDADDVVQETLTRVLAARGRLEDVTLTAYAFTVARSVMADHHRDASLQRRHAPRLVDLSEPAQPDSQVLAAEDRRALATALQELPSPQREQLVEHVVHDTALVDLADPGGPGAPAVAAQMARARAKLRLDYLLALRKVTLPTARCRPVLLALSAADQRRQATLRAGPHLLTCRVCADLSAPLLQRRRALAGFIPWIPLGTWHGDLVRMVKQHPGPSAAAAATATAAVAAMAVAVASPGAAPPAPTAGPAPAVSAAAPSPAGSAPSASPTTAATPGDAVLSGPGGPVLPRAGALDRLVGQQVRARGVRVLAVPADEGFWVGSGPDERVWVQLPEDRESGVRVRPGQRLLFEATVVAHGAGFAGSVGITPAEGAAMLTRQGAHLRVRAGTLTVQP